MNKEISAEMLLEYLYPEKESRWNVTCLGTFYRNYNADSVHLDAGAGTVELARDGFLKYLPDGMVSDVSDLKDARDKAAAYDKLNYRLRLLSDAFSPIDNFNFRERLHLERQVSSILRDKVRLILNDYFGLNPDEEEDSLVRQTMLWLPFVSSYRGDLHFVKMLLRKLLDCEVEMDLSHRFSESESTRAWMPEARYTAVIPGLTVEEFGAKRKSLVPLEHFIREWFIPFDVNFVFDIRPHGSSEMGEFKEILDYNCELQV